MCFRDEETVELNAGDEVEFSLIDSSTKPVAESIRKLKTGTILSLVRSIAIITAPDFFLFCGVLYWSCY